MSGLALCVDAPRMDEQRTAYHHNQAAVKLPPHCNYFCTHFYLSLKQQPKASCQNFAHPHLYLTPPQIPSQVLTVCTCCVCTLTMQACLSNEACQSKTVESRKPRQRRKQEVTGLHNQTCYMLLQIASKVFVMELYWKLTETAQ